MSSSKTIVLQWDFAAGVYQSLWTRDTVSHVGIFDPALWIIAPFFNLLSAAPPPPGPPLPSQSQSTVYTDVWLAMGGYWVVLETIFCKSLTLWPDSQPTNLLDHPKQKSRSGGDLRQINTCHKVLLQVNFFRWRHFALLSISLIFLRIRPQRQVKHLYSLCKFINFVLY